MQWILPGTVVETDTRDAEHVQAILSPMFLAGGMVLSQVASITGLEPYIIQNWVKRGFPRAAPEQALYPAPAVPDFEHQYAQGGAAHGAHLRHAGLHQRCAGR